MRLTISVTKAANDDSAHWLVLATLDGAHPDSPRHHFAVATNNEREALGIVGDLLDQLSRQMRGASLDRSPILEATRVDQKAAGRGPHEVDEWTISEQLGKCQ